MRSFPSKTSSSSKYALTPRIPPLTPHTPPAAGMVSIGVTFGQHPNPSLEKHFDVVVESVAELRQLLVAISRPKGVCLSFASLSLWAYSLRTLLLAMVLWVAPRLFSWLDVVLDRQICQICTLIHTCIRTHVHTHMHIHAPNLRHTCSTICTTDIYT